MKFRVAQCLGWCGCLAAGALLTASAFAATEDNPYSIITNRNVFRLNPPPAPKVDEKPIDLPKVMLSGFWTVGDTVKVFLVVPSKDSKEPPTYLTLRSGEGNQDLEVVQIRADKGEVDILNAGTPQTLTLASNGVAATSAPVNRSSGPPAMPMPFHRPFQPVPHPAQAAAPATSTGGSAIVIGGNSEGSSAIIGGGGTSINSGNAFVGGGAAFAGGPGTQGIQVPSLFNQPAGPGTATGVPQNNSPPASLPQQIINLKVNEATGGPPAPPIPGLDGPPAPP